MDICRGDGVKDRIYGSCTSRERITRSASKRSPSVDSMSSREVDGDNWLLVLAGSTTDVMYDECIRGRSIFYAFI